MIIVDECHHIPARMFRNVITNFNPYYLYGLTATPERKNNDAKLSFIYLGDILHAIDRNFNKELSTPQAGEITTRINPRIIIRDTDLSVPFKIKTDNFQLLSKIITFDSNRNRQIVDDVREEVNKGSNCLVLTERKEHVAVLNYYLKREYETIILTGDLTEKQRNSKIRQIETGHFQIVLATGQLIGEGTDLPFFNCLFLVYPFAFSGKLTQYIGRIQRGDNANKVIYDYRDHRIDYLEKFFKKRLRYYKKNFEIV
jgi:superfamily II DNA or RNA helicase